MNRRHFFKQLASGLIVATVAPTYFLPPRGGWRGAANWSQLPMLDFTQRYTSLDLHYQAFEVSLVKQISSAFGIRRSILDEFNVKNITAHAFEDGIWSQS
jgi:hypothetical protein